MPAAPTSGPASGVAAAGEATGVADCAAASAEPEMNRTNAMTTANRHRNCRTAEPPEDIAHARTGGIALPPVRFLTRLYACEAAASSAPAAAGGAQPSARPGNAARRGTQ